MHNNFEEDDDEGYSSFLLPFKNTIFEIIFKIKNANDSDNGDKGI